MLRFWVVRFHSHERAVNRASSPKRIMCPIPCASSVVSFFALLGGGSLGFAFWTSIATGTGGGAGAFVMRCGGSQVVFMAWFKMFFGSNTPAMMARAIAQMIHPKRRRQRCRAATHEPAAENQRRANVAFQ